MTPVFMPVGTAGTVKALHQRELKEDIQAPIILGNTYHLYLRPGTQVLEAAGGLHPFMSWDRPILTDSGGYQVFSLSENRKITEDGVLFRSHIDGSSHLFSPESSIRIQRSIGADIMMAFDECTPYPATRAEATRSMNLTHQWMQRSFEAFHETIPLYGFEQVLFPIIQGGVYPDLRKLSAQFAVSMNAFGNAIGGLSVGEPAILMYEMTAAVSEILPEDKPRYLMGVGTPANLLECISLGMDMFDCVMPTRNARNGMLFTSSGILNMRNEKWKNDHSSLDPQGSSFVDSTYTKAYLRHLFVSKEILACQIATHHNLSFYQWLMREAGEKIKDGTFSDWKKKMVPVISKKI